MATKNNESCVCCLGADIEDHGPQLLRCVQCGHVWANIDLSNEDIAALYSESYFQGTEYKDYEKEANALRHNFERQLNKLIRQYPNGGRLLDIGCAYGFFLQLASQHFSAVGCDIADHAVAYARDTLGLDAYCVDYMSWTHEQPFEVICLWDTIEHLKHPEQYIAKAATELCDDGELVLTTGDIGSWMARLRGKKWRLLHPPTHIHYFTATSIRLLLERLGFRTISIRYHAFWRSADATAFRLLACPPNKRTSTCYRILNNFGLLNFSIPINTFDLMTVSAKK